MIKHLFLFLYKQFDHQKITLWNYWHWEWSNKELILMIVCVYYNTATKIEVINSFDVE